MANSVIKVDGMSCGHCVETINNALAVLPGMNSIAIDLENKSVAVDYDDSSITLETISDKILEVGFEVKDN